MSTIIEKIRSEIERQIALLPTVGYSTQIAGDYIPVQNTLNYLLSFLSALESEKWSAEDEEMLEYVISDVNDAKELFATKEAIDLCDKEIAWLKSLRPQKKED